MTHAQPTTAAARRAALVEAVNSANAEMAERAWHRLLITSTRLLFHRGDEITVRYSHGGVDATMHARLDGLRRKTFRTVELGVSEVFAPVRFAHICAEVHVRRDGEDRWRIIPCDEPRMLEREGGPPAQHALWLSAEEVPEPTGCWYAVHVEPAEDSCPPPGRRRPRTTDDREPADACSKRPCASLSG